MSNSANVSRLLRFDVTISIMQMLLNNIQDDLDAIRSTHVEDDDVSDSDTEIDTHSIAASINSISTCYMSILTTNIQKNNVVTVINTYLLQIIVNIRKCIIK